MPMDGATWGQGGLTGAERKPREPSSLIRSIAHPSPGVATWSRQALSYLAPRPQWGIEAGLTPPISREGWIAFRKGRPQITNVCFRLARSPIACWPAEPVDHRDYGRCRPRVLASPRRMQSICQRHKAGSAWVFVDIAELRILRPIKPRHKMTRSSAEGNTHASIKMEATLERCHCTCISS